jgi:Fe-S-cluster-containing hydrogenase component 2
VDRESRLAVKCDLCEGTEAGAPACISACPTAARRIVPVAAGVSEDEARLRDEYQARVKQSRPAVPDTYEIDPEVCICCGRCARQCPVECISGTRGKPPARATDEDKAQGKVGEPFHIDREACIRCGSCFEVCPVGAVTVS